jgi:hypothetical protein
MPTGGRPSQIQPMAVIPKPILLTKSGRLSLRAAMKYAPATCQILCAEALLRPCHPRRSQSIKEREQP